jgi:ABC-type dipeptide/oligopeptide/nickel transport system permease subunit
MRILPGTVVELDRPVTLSARDALRRVNRLPLFDKAVLVVFALLLLISFIGPLLATHSPTESVAAPFTHPSRDLPMGTDDIGRDIWTRVLYGARESWLGAFAVITSAVIIGSVIGVVSGASGGWIDSILMRLTDAFLALPAPVLALAIAAALGASYTNTLIAVAVVWWPLYARIVRGEIRALNTRTHVEAAKLSGVSRRRLLWRHLFPGALPPVIIAASLDVGGLILTVAGLSFLGLGAPEPAPELGAMTAQGLPYVLSSPWVPIFPAAAIFVIALFSNLAGDSIRDLLDQ